MRILCPLQRTQRAGRNDLDGSKAVVAHRARPHVSLATGDAMSEGPNHTDQYSAVDWGAIMGPYLLVRTSPR